MMKGKEGVGTALQMALWLFGNNGRILHLNQIYFMLRAYLEINCATQMMFLSLHCIIKV